jgi:hypothetical protein
MSNANWLLSLSPITQGAILILLVCGLALLHQAVSFDRTNQLEAVPFFITRGACLDDIRLYLLGVCSALLAILAAHLWRQGQIKRDALAPQCLHLRAQTCPYNHCCGATGSR